LAVVVIGILLIALVLVYDGSYRHSRKLEDEKSLLKWSSDRPVVLFDSWGEVPHDHPEARFHEHKDLSGQLHREYWERGFYLTNQGGTAHEVSVLPIQLSDNIRASGGTAPRIDRESTGFLFAWLDTEKNAKFGEDFERWDLLKVMAAIEKKVNSTRVEEYPLSVEVGVCYRDVRKVWFVSFARLKHRADLNRLVFGSTEQMLRTFPSKEAILKALDI
jgi:hypothetical protein